MNNIETEILALLKHDCRLTADKIAKAVGSDENTVKKTITDLEKRGVILGYSALTDEHALGGDTVEALIEVRVNPMYGRGFDAIAEDIYKFEQVKSLYLMSGGYALAVFISEKLSVMDKVLSTATHFILKKYKIGGVTAATSEEKRQPVTP